MAELRFHDFHLEGYSVAKYGTEITLDLVYNYEGTSKEESRIKFSEVAIYHFVHMGGSIITDIEHVTLAFLFDRVGEQLANWFRMHGGYGSWSSNVEDMPQYATSLERDGFQAWMIDSAIGFEGFVIAKSVQQLA